MNPEEVVHTPENGTEQEPKEPQNPSEPVGEPTPATPAQPPAEDIEALKRDRDEWKQKATAQGQENIVLNDKIKRHESRQELTNEPTDSELQAAFPEVDLGATDPFTKRILRESFQTRKLAEGLAREREAERESARWNNDLEMTIASNPSLQGKEQAFKTFANKPTHRGAPLGTLVSAFLFDASVTPAAPVAPTPAAPGLLPGNGGPRVTEKPKLLTPEALKTLRTTNEKAYRDYVRDHDLSQLEL